jgi:hypothetical protein
VLHRSGGCPVRGCQLLQGGHHVVVAALPAHACRTMGVVARPHCQSRFDAELAAATAPGPASCGSQQLVFAEMGQRGPAGYARRHLTKRGAPPSLVCRSQSIVHCRQSTKAGPEWDACEEYRVTRSPHRKF